MARDWEQTEARIREEIDRGLARAADRARRAEERAQQKAERMRRHFERQAQRAQRRASGAGPNWQHVSFLGMSNCENGAGGAGAWVGIAILAVGVGLLLQNFDILPFQEFVQFWPVILIVGGAMRVAKAKFPSARAFGIFMLIAGIIFLLGNLGLVRASWTMFWPGILIALGIKHLMRSFDPPAAAAPSQPSSQAPSGAGATASSNPLGDWNTAGRSGPETPTSGPRAGDGAPPPPPPPSSATPPASASATTQTLGPDVYLHEYCIFTGSKRRIVCDNFRGGELVAVFGGVDVDLRSCIMGGYEATIDVTAAFGGCTIRVPLNWYVDMRCVAAFGGSSNKTLPPRGGPGQRIPTLIITGSAAFGGVVVEN